MYKNVIFLEKLKFQLLQIINVLKSQEIVIFFPSQVD